MSKVFVGMRIHRKILDSRVRVQDTKYDENDDDGGGCGESGERGNGRMNDGGEAKEQ